MAAVGGAALLATTSRRLTNLRRATSTRRRILFSLEATTRGLRGSASGLPRIVAVAFHPSPPYVISTVSLAPARGSSPMAARIAASTSLLAFARTLAKSYGTTSLSTTRERRNARSTRRDP